MSARADQLLTRLPVWLQDLAISAYGLKIQHERFGLNGRHYLQGLQRDLPNETDAAALQLDHLKSTIKLALSEVPFYQRLSKATGLSAESVQSIADLHQFPIVTKDMVRENPRDFCSARQLAHRGVLEFHTSGTSGKAMTIFCDQESRRRHYAFWSRVRSWYGVFPSGRRATFFGRVLCPPEQRDPPFWRHDRVGKNLLMSSYHLSEDRLDSYLQKLAAYRPTEIIGYASSVYLLAKHFASRPHPKIRPVVIFTTADALQPQWRDVIENAFKCPLVDQYGCAEMAIFATQRSGDNFRVHPEHGILEIVDDDGLPVRPGDTGTAICTTFVNATMPLIRYKLGDRITATAGGNAISHTAFLAVEGRVDDILYTPDGRPLNRLSPIWKVVPGIRETQVIQRTIDSLDINLVVDASYRDGRSEEVLLDEIRKRTGAAMQVRLHYVPEIPKNKNGKFRAVVSELRSAS